ncbi:MAG: ribosome small subunit-dependent GTPase A [Polynucleobacter sp.]|nr:MAG: ribosome small subunit-dependent GTPase A [Polynucleobacter sp.]
MKSFKALLVASYGRHYLARSIDQADASRLYQVTSRGKQHLGAVGDILEVNETGPEQAVIESISPRKNLLYRSDAYKSKSIASNVDQILIVLATEPGFSPDLLGRAVIAAETAGITARIILNKCDLPTKLPAARKMLEPYIAMGYPVHEMSVKHDPRSVEALAQHLYGKVSVLVGQSGMGKSSLLNALIPDAVAQTQEHSKKLDSGKHTTTACRYYDLPAREGVDRGVNRGVNSFAGALIDSPGFQEFGLAHLSESELQHAFVEFRPLLGQCKFHNCSHGEEPGCVVQEAVAQGTISAQRVELFRQLRHESHNADAIQARLK